MLKFLRLKPIAKIYSHLNNYFFGDTVKNAEFLVFFRVTVGVIVLVQFLSVLPDFSLLYGMNAIIPSDIHAVSVEPQIILYNEIIDILNSVTTSEATSIKIFQYLFIGLSLLIIGGFFSRVSAIMLLILQVALVKSSYLFSYGVDFFISMSLMYIALLPSDDYFSLRGYIWGIRKKSDLTPFRRTMQLHLCLAYFVSGFEKLIGYNWRNGESVWKAIHLIGFPNDFKLNFNFIGNYPFIFILAGWFTIIVEMFYPLFINIPKTRVTWLFLTISLHIGIALILNLYFFSAIMITWNITNYYFNDKSKS